MARLVFLKHSLTGQNHVRTFAIEFYHFGFDDLVPERIQIPYRPDIDL